MVVRATLATLVLLAQRVSSATPACLQIETIRLQRTLKTTCSLVVGICPFGDDPLTGTSEDPAGIQRNEKQRVSCKATVRIALP